jgi:hypothetical protein
MHPFLIAIHAKQVENGKQPQEAQDVITHHFLSQQYK